MYIVSGVVLDLQWFFRLNSHDVLLDQRNELHLLTGLPFPLKLQIPHFIFFHFWGSQLVHVSCQSASPQFCQQFVFAIRIFHSTDLALTIYTTNIIIYQSGNPPQLPQALPTCLSVGGLQGVAELGGGQLGFTGHCKLVLNSTDSASLTSHRTFRLVPDLSFGTELATDFSLTCVGGRGRGEGEVSFCWTD